MNSHKITNANIKEWAANYDGEPFDAILCDPPYELGFMGKSWDSSGIAFDVEMWADLFRHIKPGGHLLAFSGSRTYHRMAVAIEDAGFEIRDMIEWVYGSGFPKSLNIGKAVDKIQGNEREVTGSYFGAVQNPNSVAGGLNASPNADANGRTTVISTKGNSPYEGYGTALKPAHEPCVLARKPLEKGMTVATNALKHGVGGLNIDGSRVVAYNEQYDNTKGYKGGVGSQNSKRGDNDELSSLQQGVQGVEVSAKEQKKTTDLLKDLPSKEHNGGEKSKLEGRNVEGQPNGLHNATSGQAIAERPRVSEQRVKSGDATQSSNGETLEQTTRENRTGTSPERSVQRQQDREPTLNGLGGTQQRTPQSIERDDRTQSGEQQTSQAPIGRWPSNLIHDGSDEVEVVFPQTGKSSGGRIGNKGSMINTMGNAYEKGDPGFGDSGSASRYFKVCKDLVSDTPASCSEKTYDVVGLNGTKAQPGLYYTAKSSKSERNAGLEGFEEKEGIRSNAPRENEDVKTPLRANHHPTVKPLSLTKYLATLIKPPAGGRLLVPFSGSGSEVIGALQAGWEYVEGVELTEEYIPIAEARIKYWLSLKKEESNQLELV